MNFHDRFKLLAVLHYVFAAMMFLFGFFPLLYVALGVMMFSVALGNGGPDDPPPELGLIFVAFGALGSERSGQGLAASGWHRGITRVPVGSGTARSN